MSALQFRSVHAAVTATVAYRIVKQASYESHDGRPAERPRIDAQTGRVLRALGPGVTDEAVARELGMSLRTYRRRVAELLAALDAGSRFRAGVRAGELGLTRW